MAGEHDARATSLVECGDAIAIGVVVCFIGKLIYVIEPNPLAARFIAGGTGGVDEFLEKIQ
jgi:hypothetical protein